jgi:epoxyqueuosine reductase
MQTDPGTWITTAITNFVKTSPDNSLTTPTGEKAFNAPLVGFSAGDDPLYEEFVAHIGDFYLRPSDIFNRAFATRAPGSADALTVISWVLPLTPQTLNDQAVETKRPSARWVTVRHHGERFNDALRRHVVLKLSAAGIQAVAPVLAPFWSKSSQGPYAPCSNWSERHAAYAAGLGTFGLCDGLITPVGKAMRTGSVIARAAIAPSPRPYTDHHAYCLFYSHGSCGKCIARCPVKAISKAGHDKTKCKQYTNVTMNAFIRKTYAISTYACGLCQAGVPCTDHIPEPDEG